MKVLNLYAGIGGNRKLWDEVTDVDVTAVEIGGNEERLLDTSFKGIRFEWINKNELDEVV